MIDVIDYVDGRGRSPFCIWLDGLDEKVQSRVSVALLRVADGTLTAAKSVGAGVSELRLDFGLGYRVYFGRDGDRLVILLGGGTKRRQQADIEAAHALWQEYKLEKRGK
jgi:putative addiction module killer protein